MLILTEPAQAETTAKNSRFLTEAVYVDSAEKAREIWRFRKTQYDNGGHIVYAFVVGPQGNIMGCSDDGEPYGTAGRPVLEVLKGSGITNCIITVARWFGGTKLGTGGLVHAFTICAQAVLREAHTAELVTMTGLVFQVPYPLYKPMKYLLANSEFVPEKEEFGTGVTISGQIREELSASLCSRVREMSSASILIRENPGSETAGETAGDGSDAKG